MKNRATLKQFFQLFLPSLFILLAIIFSSVYPDVKNRLATLEANQAEQIELSSHIIAVEFESITADLKLLAGDLSLKRYLDSSSEANRTDVVQTFSDWAREKKIYDQVRYLDNSGMEIFRINYEKGSPLNIAGDALQNKAGRYFFKDTIKLGQGEVFVSPLDLNIEHDQIETPYKPMIRFGTPVFDSAGRKRGIVLLNYFGNRLLHDFKKISAADNDAMFLLNRDGYWLSSPKAEDEWGFMLKNQRSFANRFPDEWKTIASGERGSLHTSRGLFVYSTVYPLLPQHRSSTGSVLPTGSSEKELSHGEYSWKIVSHTPPDLVPSLNPKQHPTPIALLLGAIVLIAIGSGYLTHSLVKRKQAEAKLVESEAHLRTIIQNEPECIKIIDAQGRLIQMNPAGLEMIEAESLEQVAGRPVLDVIAPEFREAYAELHKRVIAGETMQMEYEVLGLKGGRRWLETHAVPMQDKGETVHLAVTRDISERKRAENALKALNETLEQRVQEGISKNMEQERLLIQQSRFAAMGEMIGNIAHQWRQPLNALGLLLANIKDANDFHELDTAMINKSTAKGSQLVQKMSSTIDDFRNFFKPNKVKLDFSPVQAIEDTIQLIAPSFKNHNISVILKEGEDIKASGFPNELSQVFLNILTNAKDAMLERNITNGKVEISLHRNGNSVDVVLGDNAGGIANDILPKIFDPYFTTKEKGTGIGLYMSKMIMGHMDGNIEAHNTDVGVEFIVSIPLAATSHLAN